MMARYEGRLGRRDPECGGVRPSLAGSQAPTPAATPVPQSTERTLDVADYLELPVTGDKSTNLISGLLARGSILRDEPGGRASLSTT